MVAGETSISEESAIIADDQTTESEDDSGSSISIVSIPEAGRHLPVKVDKTSTRAQVQQLLRFERENKIAEAFLLACELVRRNPTSEFAYDAAIRTSLVLQQDQDTENFYRLAIRNARLGGKYHVQLAHFYSRTGKQEPLTRLIADYEKNNVRDPDYWLTLSRLYVITHDDAKARSTIEKAFQQKVSLFPMSVLLTQALRALNLPAEARQSVITAAGQDFGPWEKRELLLEYLKLSGITPEQVADLVRASLVNETSYHRARRIADMIVERALAERIFHPLEKHLRKVAASPQVTDIDLWLLAYMLKNTGNDEEALGVLTCDVATSTPVISYERAMSLAGARRAQEAVPILNVLLAEQPTEVPVRLTLAEQYLSLGNARHALRVLSALTLEELAPADRLKTCELAMTAAVAAGDPEAIIDHWLELSRVATFADLQAMGDVVVRAEQQREVRQKLAELLEQRVSQPTGWPLLLLRARLSAQERDHVSELQFYASYLEHDWENVQMLRFVAELALQYANAQIQLGAGARGKAKNPLVLRATNSGGTELAIRLYQRLIELQPMVPENYAALMRIYQTRGEVETAKKVALELGARDEESADVQAIAAGALHENGFPAEAIQFYRRALDLNDRNMPVRLKFAAALRDAGAPGEAANIYREVLENGVNGKPFNQPQVFAALLKIANDQKDLPGLATYLDSLREREIPGKPEFYLSSSKVLMQIGADDRAEVFLREFESKFPDHRLLPDSYLLLGQLYYNRQQNDKAIEVFKQLVEKLPDSPAAITASYNIGEVQRQSGDAKAAVDSWLDLAKQHPTNDKAMSGVYQAAVVAGTELKDRQLCEDLLRQFLESDCQDFKLMRKARTALQRMSKSGASPDLEPM